MTERRPHPGRPTERKLIHDRCAQRGPGPRWLRGRLRLAGGPQPVKADSFNVSVVQNQTLSLESDVETTHNALDLQDGPAILVGHSYGGVVITEAGKPRPCGRPGVRRGVRARRGRVGQRADSRPAPGRARAALFWRPRTGSCSWTARSSRTRSRRTSPPIWWRSWPTRRSRGASRPSTAPSASLPGAASRAGP